jgi:HPt (histidine-containing phosphotransfer) domain-containing protein
MKTSGKCTMIQPGSYPGLPSAAAAAISRQLRAPSIAAAAEQALEGGSGQIREAVLVHIDRLQAAVERMQAAVESGNFDNIYGEAHEVRGLAGNAGLNAAAAIAAELCRYLDALIGADIAPEAAVVQIHLEATIRAARAEDEAPRLGDTVAAVLSLLVTKKLAEVNALETSASPRGFSPR